MQLKTGVPFLDKGMTSANFASNLTQPNPRASNGWQEAG